MNILIITGHPAQVHNFKNLKWELEKNGHHVFFLASDKEISKYLLDVYNIKHTILSKPGKRFLSKSIHLIKNSFFLISYILKNKIDLIISRVSPYASLASFLLCKKHLALTDTETAGIYDKFFGVFVTKLFTAKSFRRQLRKDQIRFDGNIELFYLYPNRFTPIPRAEVGKLLGITPEEPYIIMRFVSWDAYHDKGLSGFTDQNKVKAVQKFSRLGKVFITAENKLPGDLERYRIKIPPEKMHDVLAHATLFFGESATMASESAVLGTPAIYLNDNWFGSTDEEAEYGLLFPYKGNSLEQTKAIQKGIELLSIIDFKEKLSVNHQDFIKNKIDVTGFMLWFIENYPESSKIMKDNPDYQYRFK